MGHRSGVTELDAVHSGETSIFANLTGGTAFAPVSFIVDSRREQERPLSNQNQTGLISVRQPEKTNHPIHQARWMACACLALGALMGCAVDARPSEADADAVGDPASSETVGTATEPISSGVLDTDSVKVTGDKIDFGGSLWGGNAPIGGGSMTWSIINGFYTPRLTGTLHLENAAGKFARMHISYWDGGGDLISTRHGGIVEPSGNGHQSWSVDLSPINLSQIVEAHVCTELSDDGVNFPQVACETYILY
jgi:hypothetical protein